MKYIGHMRGTFNDRNTGKEINFAKLYVTYPQDGVVGLKCEEIKADCALVPELAKLTPGTEIEVYYDKYRRAVNVVPEMKSRA